MDIYVIGAGGHAKVVISTIEACGMKCTGIFDDDKVKWGSNIGASRFLVHH